MYGALLVFDSDFIHIVSISFTALIVTELIMVALTIHTWHWAMLLAQVYIFYPQHDIMQTKQYLVQSITRLKIKN